MVSLLVLQVVRRLLYIVFLSDCPWPEEEEKKNTFIQIAVHFLGSIIDTLFIYMTFMVAIGYSLIRSQLDLFEIKVMFGLTCTKFLLS